MSRNIECLPCICKKINLKLIRDQAVVWKFQLLPLLLSLSLSSLSLFWLLFSETTSKRLLISDQHNRELTVTFFYQDKFCEQVVGCGIAGAILVFKQQRLHLQCETKDVDSFTNWSWITDVPWKVQIRHSKSPHKLQIVLFSLERVLRFHSYRCILGRSCLWNTLRMSNVAVS